MASLIEMNPVARESLVNDLARRILAKLRQTGEMPGMAAPEFLADELHESLSNIQLALGRVPIQILNDGWIRVKEGAWELKFLDSLEPLDV